MCAAAAPDHTAQAVPPRGEREHPPTPHSRRLLHCRPYIDDWDTFFSMAEQLYVEHPAHTRYTLKYRHTDGKVVLKVTNDRQCLKYLTDQAGDVKRIEKLNNLFVTYMCGQDPHEADVEMAESAGNAKPTSVEDSSSSKKHRGKR